MTGNNQYKYNKFDSAEWSAPFTVDVNEIKERLCSFHLVGRRITDIRFIGLCYNLRRDRIEELAYTASDGAEDEYPKYENIPGNLPYSRFAEIDEPMLIEFETKNDDPSYDDDIFEINAPGQSVFRMSMNSIPWWIDPETNNPNMEAQVLFAPCIGKTITDVEVNTYTTKTAPMTSGDIPDTKTAEPISDIVLRLEDGIALRIEGQQDVCHVHCINSFNENLTIPFDELKKGLFNREDLRTDEASGFEADTDTFYFGSCGSDHCVAPYMTLMPSTGDSKLHISVDDFTLFAWCIGNLFDLFDEYSDYEYSFKQWQSIMDEAEKLLSFTFFDELFDYRIGLWEGRSDEPHDNYFLNEMNCQGLSFWMNRDKYHKQLEEMRKWTSTVLTEDASIDIYGF